MRMRVFILFVLMTLTCANLRAWTEVSSDLEMTGRMRCRVVAHTDEVQGTKYVDNNVDRTFPMLQVIRKYSENLDILVMFGLNGPNGMFGIRRFAFIQNTNREHVSEFPGQIWWSEMYETVGPWYVRAVNNPIEQSSQKFTGGFHSYIDRETGSRYPSGENLGYTFIADGKELSVGDEVMCDEIECISKERLGAYNTFDPEAGSGRMVMEFENRYNIKGDKIYLHSAFRALEDIVIELHYGLQTVSHNPFMYFMSDDGVVKYDTAEDYPAEVGISGIPHGICGERSDGRCFFARMSETGAFVGSRNDEIKFFGRNYGPSNFKQYHHVYGNGKVVQMETGEGDFYEGYFCFSPKIDGSLFPNYGHLEIDFIQQDASDTGGVVFEIRNREGYFYDNIYCSVKEGDNGDVRMIRSPLTYIPEGTSRIFRIDRHNELGLGDIVGPVDVYRKIGGRYELIQRQTEITEIDKGAVHLIVSGDYLQILNLPETSSMVMICDMSGRIILEKKCDYYQNMVKISGLQMPQIYLIKVYNHAFSHVSKILLR